MATNAYLELANQQGQILAYNSHAYIRYETKPEANKNAFIEYTLDLYCRMLEENVDNLIENIASGMSAGQA